MKKSRNPRRDKQPVTISDQVGMGDVSKNTSLDSGLRLYEDEDVSVFQVRLFGRLGALWECLFPLPTEPGTAATSTNPTPKTVQPGFGNCAYAQIPIWLWCFYKGFTLHTAFELFCFNKNCETNIRWLACTVLVKMDRVPSDFEDFGKLWCYISCPMTWANVPITPFIALRQDTRK